MTSDDDPGIRREQVSPEHARSRQPQLGPWAQARTSWLGKRRSASPRALRTHVRSDSEERRTSCAEKSPLQSSHLAESSWGTSHARAGDRSSTLANNLGRVTRDSGARGNIRRHHGSGFDDGSPTYSNAFEYDGIDSYSYVIFYDHRFLGIRRSLGTLIDRRGRYRVDPPEIGVAGVEVGISDIVLYDVMTRFPTVIRSLHMNSVPGQDRVVSHPRWFHSSERQSHHPTRRDTH